MKCINYLGAEGDCIVIQQPTDIYPLLDWCHSRMIENQQEEKGSVNVGKWQKAIDYLSTIMVKCEADGFGNFDDVENIEY
jgi:hypothetical protein